VTAPGGRGGTRGACFFFLGALGAGGRSGGGGGGGGDAHLLELLVEVGILGRSKGGLDDDRAPSGDRLGLVPGGGRGVPGSSHVTRRCVGLRSTVAADSRSVDDLRASCSGRVGRLSRAVQVVGRSGDHELRLVLFAEDLGGRLLLSTIVVVRKDFCGRLSVYWCSSLGGK
jgi:hypothetical protein